MKLKIGKMKSKELAEWFGITAKSYSNARKKKLEELKTFCSFKEIWGGVIIEEIYIEEYISLKDYHLIEIMLRDRNNERNCSYSGMSRKQLLDEENLYRKYRNPEYDKKVRAGVKAFQRISDKMFGVFDNTASTPEERNYSKGPCGEKRRKIWQIKLNDYNNYRELTQEEEELFKQLIQETFPQDNLINLIKDKGASSLKELKEEAERESESFIKDFNEGVIQRFKDITGKQLATTMRISWLEECNTMEVVLKKIGGNTDML